MSQTQIAIRLGKAFDGIFDEVMARQHGQRGDRTDAGAMQSKRAKNRSSRAFPTP